MRYIFQRKVVIMRKTAIGFVLFLLSEADKMGAENEITT
jgi:hypothetical protein